MSHASRQAHDYNDGAHHQDTPLTSDGRSLTASGRMPGAHDSRLTWPPVTGSGGSLAGTTAQACAANPDVAVALALTPTLRPRSQTRAGAAPAAAAASCRCGGRDFDPQRAAASVAERRVVDRACGEHEDQVPLGEEGDGVAGPWRGDADHQPAIGLRAGVLEQVDR